MSKAERLNGNSGIKAGDLSRDAANEGGTSLKSFQPSTSSAWQRVGQGKTAVKPSKVTSHQTVHHFGLLDVPAPEQLFNSSDLPVSWRGASHAPVSIPEVSELMSPLETVPQSQSQQLIRPKASRKPGDSRSQQRGTHHHAILPRAGVAGTNMEGSATSDDHENSHSRLIPKRGQGPGLRSEGGGKIDEYLMRLLRAGGPPAQSGQKRTDVTGHRNVSQLGPLPGAGVMASAVQLSGCGKANMVEKRAPKTGEKRGFELMDAMTEPKTEPSTRLTQTQPSIAGENREEAHQASQSVHPDKRRASIDRTTGKVQTLAVNGAPSGHFSVKVGQLNAPGGQTAATSQLPSSNGHAEGPDRGALSGRLKQRLGQGQWDKIRSSVGTQLREFQWQVTELHRLRGVQARFPHHSSTLRPSPATHQNTSLGSSRPSGMNGTGRSGTASLAAASWKPDMERFGSNAEAFSWPVFQAAQAQANLVDAAKQKSEPVKVLSQTTQLALNAQRMRRKLRDRQSQPGKVPSIGNPISSEIQANGSAKRLVPQAETNWPPIPPQQAQGFQQNLSMWHSYMLKQQQHQALHSESMIPPKPKKPVDNVQSSQSNPFFVKVEKMRPGHMYYATCIDFPGMSALGNNEEHAIAMFKYAVRDKLLQDRDFKMPMHASPELLARDALDRGQGSNRMKTDSDKHSQAILRAVRFD